MYNVGRTGQSLFPFHCLLYVLKQFLGKVGVVSRVNLEMTVAVLVFIPTGSGFLMVTNALKKVLY